MSRSIRTIKPEVLIDDTDAAGLSDTAWRLWVGLRLLADDYGNARAGERFLAARIWQDSGRVKSVTKARAELADSGRLALYIAGGETFAHIVGWNEEQRTDRRSDHTRNPAPDYPYRATSAGPCSIEVELIQDVRRSFAATSGEPPRPAAVRRAKQSSAARAGTRARAPDPDLGSGIGSGIGSPIAPVGFEPDQRPISEPQVFEIPRCFAVAFAKGIQAATGSGASVPSSRGDTDRLMALLDAHAATLDTAARCDWLAATAETYAKTIDALGRPPKLAVWAFQNWLDERHRGPAMRPGLQRPAPAGKGWTPARVHTPEDTSDAKP